MSEQPTDGSAEQRTLHPRALEPATLIVGILLALLGVVVGLELITRVGITPNSSIIGAIIAIALSRIPLGALKAFRSTYRQNLLQTTISGATFGGANALLLPLGVLWLLGEPDLIPTMMLGALLGLLIDAAMVYRLFGSKVYPATGLWPVGIATAECIMAGDRGGRRARLLGLGGIIGGAGRYLGIPMDVFGVCWIGNIWALSMFGIGLLARGYAPVVVGVDLNERHMPHGVMLGAGVVALVQIVVALRGAQRAQRSADDTDEPGSARGTLVGGFGAFGIAAGLVAVVGGVHAELSIGMLAAFVVFAAAAALVS